MPTDGAADAVTPHLCAWGHRNGHWMGGRGRVGNRRGAEGCVAVSGGDTENATEGKVRDDRGKGGRDGGRRGDGGGSYWLRSHGLGPADPRGLRRLGVLQRWSASQWGYKR